MTDLRKYKTSTKTSVSELGKIPPQAVELEEAVLGALMLEKCADIVTDILTPQSFYKDAHVRIFGACMNLYKLNSPIDILTVTEELKKTGELELVGGAYYITQLTNRVASSSNVEHHARIVAEKFILREIIRTSTIALNQAYENDVDCFDVLKSVEDSFSVINNSFYTGKIETPLTVMRQIIERNKMLATNKGVNGVPTGIIRLDKQTAGWQKTDLIIIAARPAMGKTALALTLARNAAVDYNIPVAIFSLEMSALQLVTRLLSAESKTNSARIAKSHIPDDEFNHMVNESTKMLNSNIYIDDTPSLNVLQLRSKARKFVKEMGVQLIIVDYLQLMVGKDDKNVKQREQEVAAISRSLKSLAKELNIPIIALAQLSRALETRGGDRRPILSDLRESGSIEQDADTVIFIHRDEYYGITEDSNGDSTAGIAELIFAKHRSGPVGLVKTKWTDYLTTFTNIGFESPVVISNPNKFIEPNTEFLNHSHDIEEDQPF